MKSSSVEVVLPYLRLADRLVYLPGVTYRTVLTKSDGMKLLSRYTSAEILNAGLADAIEKYYSENAGTESRLEISDEAKAGVRVVGEYDESTRDAPMIACLPGFQETTALTVCQVTEVEISADRAVVGFRALYRGNSVATVEETDSSVIHGETECTVETSENFGAEFKDSKTREVAFDVIVPQVLRLYANVEKFLDKFVNLPRGKKDATQDERLKQIFLRLSPLAAMLYGELSEEENNVGMRRLLKYYQEISKSSKHNAGDYQRLCRVNDVFVALFPFGVKQKCGYLAQMDAYERLSKFAEDVDYGNNMFEKYLDMDYVLGCWKTMEQQAGSGNSRVLRARFMGSYIRSLRMLLEQIGTPSSVAARQKGGRNGLPQNNNNPLNMLGMGGDQEDEDDPDLERVQEFVDHIGEYKISTDGKRLIRGDFKRMSKMPKSSSDYQVMRTYMDVIMDIPWVKKADYEKMVTLDVDMTAAKDQLDHDHYGMDSVKERILEYLAVLKLENRIRKRRNQQKADASSAEAKLASREALQKSDNSPSFVIEDVAEPENESANDPHDEEDDEEEDASSQETTKAPILLLTGPPGVGKTSLARSIAGTLGRKFQRVSLGGLNDFAELKGHRRTYVGAAPGLIVQALRRAQSSNPVILLDEIDKVSGASRQGNPEAALLEILDPEQNTSFQDHYVGFPIDLSQVLFICTSNDQWQISDPLRDRMEMIELAGYSYYEKVEICRTYLVPRQIERNALPTGAVSLNSDAILKIATEYTRESGIRNLERLVASICRSKAIEYSDLVTDDFAEGLPDGYDPVVTIEDLPKYIGIAHHLADKDSFGKQITNIQEPYGLANGLSYNSDGSGSLLKFEMVGLPGGKSLSCTGNLGEVLMESAEIANTLVGFMLNKRMIKGIDAHKALERYNDTEVHLHVPEGAVSKDGPSAGITMTTCLLSLILKKPVPSNLAMTGEITLTGKVLPIGGLKEKLLGAHLTGKIKKVIVPRLNRRDIILDYVAALSDRTKAHEVMASLTLEEERMLQTREPPSPFLDPERWLLGKLGIAIVYAEDFSDVVSSVWDDEIRAKIDHDEEEQTFAQPHL